VSPSGGRILVTGAASGLGAALARAFEARGDTVLATDRAEGGLEEYAHRLRLDITSDDDWAAARDWVERAWGGLAVRGDDAGVAGGGRIDVAPLEEWSPLVEVNLLGTVRGTRTFVPVFKRQRSGTIVNVASLAGLVHPAGMASYNAVKAAVVAFTETAGHELAAYGVHCAVVCPSYFRTNLMEGMTGADQRVGQIVSGLVASSGLTADDVAAAVLTGLDQREEVIIPDEPARRAWSLKQNDRAAYDAVMRQQAAKLNQET